MFIQYFFTESLSHISYMLIAGDGALVIDPKRDIQDYLDEANKRNIQIVGVLLTHPHADFVAGHLELKAATGAQIYAHRNAPFQFDFQPLEDGFEWNFHHVNIKVLETPGHTPFDVSFVLTDTSRGTEPISIFTGDTLFVGDVGRPDLFPGMQKELALQMFHSLQKLLKLPDFVEIYPAHAAGTLCGKKLAEKRTSTIGYEKRFNPMLQISQPDNFMHTLLTDLPATPRHFKRCATINSGKITYLKDLPPVTTIDFDKFEQIKDQSYIIDLRSHIAWVGGHIPGSISLDFDCLPLSVYAGWLLEPDKNIILLTDRDIDFDHLAIQFRRVGLDQKIYVLEKALNKYLRNGKIINRIDWVYPEQLPQYLSENYTIIDVRSNIENNPFATKHYMHIPLMKLETALGNLDQSQNYLLVCQVGVSAIVAASILKKHHYSNIRILAGGMDSLKNK